MPEPSTSQTEISLEEGAAALASISPHYDDKNDNILRVECVGGITTKSLTAAMQLVTLGGVGLLITMIVLISSKPKFFFFKTQSLYIFNTAIAAFQLGILIPHSLHYARNVVKSARSKKRWSHRRFRAVQLAFCETLVQIINSILFLAPNVRQIARGCTWFDASVGWMAFVRLTCWNVLFLIFLIAVSNLAPVKGKYFEIFLLEKRNDAILLDASLWVHWPHYLLWILLEGLLVATAILQVRFPPVKRELVVDAGSSCAKIDYTCNFTKSTEILSYLMVLMPLSYFCLYFIYTKYTFNQYRKLPYMPYRMGNTIIRLQIRIRTFAFVFFVATFLISFIAGSESCSTFVLIRFGLTPAQLVMTASVFCWGLLAMPVNPQQKAVLQVWLQEFAWTESDIPRKMEERASSLPLGSFEGFCIDCEPLFCFETALKLMYWSFLAYGEGETVDSGYSSRVANRLFGLENFELLWEKGCDTKAVIGWSQNTVVISFRGSASFSNAITDLKIWRKKHPFSQSAFYGLALVHGGFLGAYTFNRFNERILDVIKRILHHCQGCSNDELNTTREQSSASHCPRVCHVYVTGHSLGGALAVLCAYDIVKRNLCDKIDVSVQCMTFGAPRVGNRAWAKDFDSVVKDCWQVINADDAVTRAGKFFGLFKHVGHRVLINRRGLMLVRPSFVEYSVRRSPGGSVKDHFLTSYQKAFYSILYFNRTSIAALEKCFESYGDIFGETAITSRRQINLSTNKESKHAVDLQHQDMENDITFQKQQFEALSNARCDFD